ncbi:MAG TPA: S9 family peptidase, partial [Cyclobacteriaceae bacterium]|nr:S9 family peptidase [Cyclobacteriaceae bacterium]
MKKILLLLLISQAAWAQTLGPLTVEKIMRDPKWIGVAPSNLNWSADSKQLYFNWNPDKNQGDSLYSITLANRAPQKVQPVTRRALPSFFGSFNKTFTKKLFEKSGDLFLLDVATGKITQVTNTVDRESGASF